MDNYVFAGTANGIYRARLDELTAIEDNPKHSNTFIVSPNPVLDICNIRVESQYPAKANIRFYNMTGINVLNEKIKISSGANNLSFDVSEFYRGAYIVELNLGKGIRSALFIKD